MNSIRRGRADQASAKNKSEKIEQRLVSGGQKYDVPAPIIANFLAGSFLSLVKWWLDNKMTYFPEEMDEMFRKLALAGIVTDMGR